MNQYEYEENDELTLDETEEESSDEEHYEEPEEGEEGEGENSHFFEPENGEKTAKNGEATQFKPGNAGGPGRPRKPKTMKAIIRRWLFAGSEEDARRVLDTLFEKAIEGNLTAIRLLLEHSKPDKDPR